jgi:hypothetical protein
MNEPIQIGGLSIDEAERLVLRAPQVECPVYHIFLDGMYIRELHMPAGTMAIGHHQNFEHCNILIQGKVRMLDGTILEAPLAFKGQPGRKVGEALEDVIWQNVYVTNERDVDLLESLLLTKSPGFLEDAMHKYLEGALDHEVDRAHHADVLDQLGYTQNQVQEQVENLEDQIELPPGCYKVKLGISSIHGRGVITTAPIQAGEVIGTARCGTFRTPLGRFTNHAKEPNAVMRQYENNVVLVALQDLPMNREVTINYRDTIELTRSLT